MNSYADKSEDSGRSNAVANTFSERQAKNASAQFHAPDIIQRYSIVQPGNIHAKKGAKIETQDIEQTPFGSTYVTRSNRVTHSGYNPQTSETTTEKTSGNQAQQNSTLPAFKVSENGFLAVPQEGQSKNLYADKNSVQDSNQVLAANGSRIRLQTQGIGIMVPKNPANPNHNRMRPLKKVHAAMPAKTNGGIIYNQIQQELPFVQCNGFIELVLGVATNTSRIAILENEEQERDEIKAPEGKEPVSEIATVITEGKTSPSKLVDELNDNAFTNDIKKTGKRNYENLTDTKREKRSKEIGINEYANPEIGEGYMIRSMETNAKLDLDDQGLTLPGPQIIPVDNKTQKQRKRLRDNYLQAIGDLDNANAIINKSRLGVPYGVQTMMHTWGEHYAGVVAKDGADTVTLENYNRSAEVAWEYERIFNNLFRTFSDFRNLVSAKVDSLSRTPSTAVIQQLVTLAAQGQNLQLAYQTALNEATQSFQTGLAEMNHTFGEQFYFDMYGPGAQSFHEKFKGATANAVTLRITEDSDEVKQGVVITIQDLHQTIARWEPVISAHPLSDDLMSVFDNLIANARQVEANATNDLQNANTRSKSGEIMAILNTEADVFRNGMKDTVRGAYQVITGQAPNPAITGADDLVQNCLSFQGTYRWYDTVDAPFHYSVELEAMAKDLARKHLF
jgi:hypothetical protein